MKRPKHAMLKRTMKKLEQGITDFKEFIDENCYFVDKTHLIGYLIDHPSKVHLITRPRRFGKTLNLSMIRHFLEATPPSKGPKWLTLLRSRRSVPANAYLFKDRCIASHPRYTEFMGQYPVIHISFKNVKKSTFEKSLNFIKDVLSDEFIRHSYLLECGCISTLEKPFFRQIIQKEAKEEDFEKSLKYLSAWLHRAYGKPPYILLDEYDTPLHSAHVDRYYDQMIAFIRSFMVQTFKDNPHLKQAVVIGILKIAQESIFSDFNNPRVSTILSPAMKDCFGFTEPEVEKMASYFGLESKMDGIKEWYNGYLFGGDTVIYNPWSIVNYLRSPEEGLTPHWIGTSDNRLIKDVIQLDRREAKMTIEKLLRKEEVRKPLLTNIPYPQVESDPDVVWSFLLHSGYLKASERQQEHRDITWRLAIPNLEVETAWITVISRWLKEDIKINEHFTDFVTGIQETSPRHIERGLSRILRGLASYHDTAKSKEEGEDEESKRENFYHGLVLGLLACLSPAYTVESNREYGEGRPDIVVVRKGNNPSQAEEAVLLEFKHGNAKDGKALEDLAREAHTQAVEKYLNGVREKWHPQRLLVLGAGFKGRELAVFYDS